MHTQSPHSRIERGILKLTEINSMPNSTGVGLYLCIPITQSCLLTSRTSLVKLSWRIRLSVARCQDGYVVFPLSEEVLKLVSYELFLYKLMLFYYLF